MDLSVSTQQVGTLSENIFSDCTLSVSTISVRTLRLRKVSVISLIVDTLNCVCTVSVRTWCQYYQC